MKLKYAVLFVVVFFAAGWVFAKDVIELDTTTIKGNTELPKYLYVVPWKNKEGKRDKQRKLRLHNLNGDLFDPVMPENNLVELEQVLPEVKE